MRAATDGNWTGRSPFDDAERVYAFARSRIGASKVLVGRRSAEAMSAADAWEQNALIFAGGITLLVLLMTALLLRELYAGRRRHEVLAHERAILEATLTGMSDGIIMVDSICA